MNIDDQMVEFALWDTAGQEDFDRLRPLCYPDTHIILVCFSIELPDSLRNVEERWVPEILHFCSKPMIPYLLVGCKKDLRHDSDAIELKKKYGGSFVAVGEGERAARKIGAKAYMECSSKTGEGVQEVLKHAASLSLQTKLVQKRECLIL